MISCTEFIPLYSEFFSFLEARGGHDAVLRYWYHISDTSIGDETNPNSLRYNCEKYGGFEGALKYWGHTLTEEACDLFKIVDRDNRYVYSHMRHCPSRGMLNDLKHIEPYYDYCSHCNVIYQRVLDDYDIIFERDNSMVAQAQCCSLLYEKGHRPEGDYTIPSANAEVIDMKTEDNKYLHRDFHLLSDNAIAYAGEKFGDNCAVDFLATYAKHYYSPQIEDIKARGLVALKEWIEKVYEIEEASEVLHTELDGEVLTVTIDKSPVIEYMHSLNQEPSRYYIEQTRTLYSAIADACDLGFNLEYYNEDGGTKFRFFKRSF